MITNAIGLNFRHDETCVCEGTAKVLKADGYEMVDVYPCTQGKIISKGNVYSRDPLAQKRRVANYYKRLLGSN